MCINTYRLFSLVMTNNTNMPHRRINITLPVEIIEKAKRIAQKERRTISNLIRILIEDYQEK